MVSSSNQPHQQPNALFVPSPLILSSSASTSMTPASVISSIAQHQQPILQMLHQQQRPLLFSQQPQMIVQGQNGQLLPKPANGSSPMLKQAVLNQLAQANAAQQTFLINSNLLPQAQQQVLINKQLIDSQRGKHIVSLASSNSLQRDTVVIGSLTAHSFADARSAPDQHCPFAIQISTTATA